MDVSQEQIRVLDEDRPRRTEGHNEHRPGGDEGRHEHSSICLDRVWRNHHQARGKHRWICWPADPEAVQGSQQQDTGNWLDIKVSGVLVEGTQHVLEVKLVEVDL
jgi:hypothetical protein